MSDDDETDPIAQFEARWAAGFTEEAGSHITADGLVARNGNRRVLPGWMDEDTEWLEFLEDDVAEIGSKVLHGPDATIFEGRILRNPERSVESLAEQLGKTPRQIYKWTEHITRKLRRAMQHKRNAGSRTGMMPQTAQACPTCGVVYEKHNWSACKRGYSHLVIFNQKSPHPQCFPDWVMYRPKGKRA